MAEKGPPRHAPSRDSVAMAAKGGKGVASVADHITLRSATPPKTLSAIQACEASWSAMLEDPSNEAPASGKRTKAAIYARVSKDEQELENQLHLLRQYAEDQELEVVAEFIDINANAETLAYRCADCSQPFCLSCIQLHFAAGSSAAKEAGAQ